MSNFSRLPFVFLLLTLFAGCAAQRDPENAGSHPSVAAPSNISAAFSIAKDDPALAVDNARVAIFKSALDKEFLLQANLVSMDVAPSFSGLKSRVVLFKRQGAKLYMMESPIGHKATDDMPMTLLLAEFPVLAETDERLVFDFNAGMSNIFMSGEWYASDIDGSGYSPTFTSVKSRMSYLDGVELSADNQLVIRQMAQLALGSGGKEQNPTVLAKYYLSPYRPDPTFEPTKSKDFDVMGFFEVNPVLRLEGDSVVRATKFHPKKPIVFAISDSTPAAFRDAVREGVLYWNKAFGEERVQVIDAPKGVTGPDMKYNMVQWVNWDTAGFAFADAQADPRTGEILHAQVYFTSAFAALGKEHLRSILKRIGSREGHSETKINSSITLAGFQHDHHCRLDLDKLMSASLAELEAMAQDETVDDARVLKAAQDWVRAVAAHEIGHTLGLRHNFAGSLATNFALSKRSEVFGAYLKDGAAPKGTVVTSSVMDYLRFEEDVIAGEQLKSGAKAFEYDDKAIDTLYAGKSYKLAEVPPFCTDSDLSTYVDCKQSDTGASSVEFQAWSAGQRLANYHYSLIEDYVSRAKSPFVGDVVPVEQVDFSVEYQAYMLTAPKFELFKMIAGKPKLLSIRRNHPFVSDMNEEEVREEELDHVASEMERLGGVEGLFAAIPADFTNKAFEKFVELLNSGQYARGMGPNGKKYEFSTAEIAVMKNTVRKLMDKLKPELREEELAALAGQPTSREKAAIKAGFMKAKELKLPEHELTGKIVEVMASRLAEYVFAVEEGKDTVVEVEIANTSDKKDEPATKKVTVTLPKFAYPIELRLVAAALFKGGRGEAIDWGIYEKARYKKRFGELLKKALGDNTIDKFKPEDMPRPVAKWLLQNKQVSDALGGMSMAGVGLPFMMF